MNEPKQSKRVVEDDEKLFINLFMVIDSVLIWPEVCWSCWLGLPDRVCLWPLPSPGEIAAWILACDWLTKITWPDYWPLIGWGRGRSMIEMSGRRRQQIRSGAHTFLKRRPSIFIQALFIKYKLKRIFLELSFSNIVKTTILKNYCQLNMKVKNPLDQN